MQKTTHLPLFIATILILASLATVVPAALAAPITVQTDKDAYGPGESLNVSGTATANAWISIQLFNPDGNRVAIAQAQAGSDGAWSATGIYTFAEDDPQGTWTVKAYDSATGETAETTFTFPAVPADTIPPTLTVSLVPTKDLYGVETITIVVQADEPLGSCSITVTQAGASPTTVEATAAVDDPTKWGGSYSIAEGYDGTATIEVEAADLAGNTQTATAYFTVDTAAPSLTISAPATTTEATIKVSGTVDDPTITTVTITVDTTSYAVDVTAGSFSTTITLPAPGTYTIKAEAADAAGNTGTASTSVTYAVAPPMKAEEIVKPIKEDIAAGTKSVKEDIAAGTKAIKEDIAALKADVGGVKSDIAGVKGDISGVKGDISTLKADVSGLKTDVSALKSDIASVKSDVADLGSKVVEVGGAVAGLSTLILTAVILSLIAAVAAIIAVVTIARKVVLK
jgi:hypothetical protein